ncbi:MAG: efflux RND transporter periplasmic adaptor subunit [Leptolyngbya sp.]|nr:efflux RND transporter periplasmic adaptor subunit [Leptolyngbya sp.]
MSQLPDLEALPAAPSPDIRSPRPRSWVGSPQLWVGLGLGVAIALVGARFLGGDRPAAAPDDPPVAAAGAAQAVTVAPVETGTVADTLTVTGTVQPADLLAITPQIGGLQIRQVRVVVGDVVGAGQPLVVLNDVDLQTQLRQAQAQVEVAQAQVEQQRASLVQAEAQLREAEANLQRYQSLQTQGAISAEELDSRTTQATTAQESVRVARAAVTSAGATVRSRQADVARLQTQLGTTVVRAPTDGVVAAVPATVGDVSSTGTAVVSLIRGNQLELAAAVPQAQLSLVTVGAPVAVTSSTDGQVQATGAVAQIEPLVDAETRTAQVIVRLPASDRLRSGMFLTAEIQVGQRSGLTIPAEALVPQPDGSLRVYVVEGDVAIARTVETGVRLSGDDSAPAVVEIRSGLAAGEQVVVAGASYLQDGDTVTVTRDF